MCHLQYEVLQYCYNNPFLDGNTTNTTVIGESGGGSYLAGVTRVRQTTRAESSNAQYLFLVM